MNAKFQVQMAWSTNSAIALPDIVETGNRNPRGGSALGKRILRTFLELRPWNYKAVLESFPEDSGRLPAPNELREIAEYS